MKRRAVFIAAITLTIVILLAGTYLVVGVHYSSHFLPNTAVNGIDVSNLTVTEAEDLIAQEAKKYKLVLTTKDDEQETITGDEIDYHYVFNTEVSDLIKEQDSFSWLPALFSDGTNYTLNTSTAYDEGKLVAAVNSLDCMQEGQMEAPTDAYVEELSDGSYTIVPENDGTELDSDKVESEVADAVREGRKTLNLELSDCYDLPKVRTDDEDLQKELEVRNRYANLTITYYIDDEAVAVLDSSVFGDWYYLDENEDPVFDYDSVYAWISSFADTYDTIGTFEPFTTSNGETVYVEAVTYGWQMDRDGEAGELYDLLMQGESADRTPAWSEGAWSRGWNDIGSTYVEIDYTNQRMWYYKDGVLLVETPVVTGNVSAGKASPEGIYCIVGKEMNATLVGEDYSTPVTYWMPFYGGVGIHDADSWRSSYGDSIYLTSGSHGCINTPSAEAAVIYENIDVGTPVVCYSSGIDYGYASVDTGTVDVTDGSGDVVITDESGDILITDGSDTGTLTDEYGTDSTVEQYDSTTDEGYYEEDYQGYDSGSDSDAGFDITITDETVLTF